MKFKKLESGRSMVEMLGVLAIIGVLSVGGIAGYSLSMRRHRANQIMDAISKYALIVYNKCQQDLLQNNQTGGHSWFCGGGSANTNYENVGIGALPAGVNSVFYSGVKTNEKTGLIYDGYSLMANWWDATLFKTEEEALQVLQNNIDTKRIKKAMLRIIKLTVKTDCVYCYEK